MRGTAKHHHPEIITAAIIICISFFTMCMNKEAKNIAASPKITYKDFAGSASCSGCHKSIYESHIHTAHFLTSQIAAETNIKGSFEKGKNIFPYNNGTYIAMEKRGSGYFQVAYFNNAERETHPFNITVGSATKGQTYLYWLNQKLFQLPITYFTAAGQWCNSPGFPDRPVFKRPITSRCLECHATFAAALSTPGIGPEKFDNKTIVYGVDCEKCHGPAAMHVANQTQNPKDTIAKYIINPSRFSRQQSLDLCALCHGGRLQKTKPSFSFIAGDSLAGFFKWDTTTQSAADIDVHGNQYGLLKLSKCFIQSNTLTCNSCHSPHQNEKNELSLYSQKCMNCHNKEHDTFCKVNTSLVASIKNNCIDCHMPKQASKSIAVFLPGQSLLTSSLIRTHFISKYPDETKKYIEQMKKQPQQK